METAPPQSIHDRGENDVAGSVVMTTYGIEIGRYV